MSTLINGNLSQLHQTLTADFDRRRDVIVPGTAIRLDGTRLLMDGEPVLTDDGVTTPTIDHEVLDTFDDTAAGRLGIPRGYLRTLRNVLPDVYADNLNGWLHHDPARRFMVRTWAGDTPQARALLSDKYRVMDNLDVLMAALNGLDKAGMAGQVEAEADLTERRMVVRVRAPQIAALAPDLLAGYRSPFSGESGTSNPTVFAGIVLSNSEVGAGAFTIVPRLTVEVCSNGMTISKDAMRNVHLGGKMDEGTVRWSSETHRRNLDLVTAQTADAVATFLDVDYMRAALAEITEQASRPVTDPVGTIEKVAKKLSYTDTQQATILAKFLTGGQATSGGVVQAITAAAQEQHPDDRYWMESKALEALALV
jgi:hypothetical protein